MSLKELIRDAFLAAGCDEQGADENMAIIQPVLAEAADSFPIVRIDESKLAMDLSDEEKRRTIDLYNNLFHMVLNWRKEVFGGGGVKE
jgi:hypothetical protein